MKRLKQEEMEFEKLRIRMQEESEKTFDIDYLSKF
tara:strand:+ start:237 stop:341 length:105 start_codon:yes stop_codon:yes gene_type:complete